MSRRIQIALTDEAWQLVETVCKEANEGFEAGSISYADVISEMVVSSKPDIRALQAKRTSIRKSLLLLSGQRDLDLDAAFKALTDLRAKTKRLSRQQAEQEVSG